MKLLSFTLSMPNRGSWNNKWSGESNLYCLIRKVDDKTFETIMSDAQSYPIYEGIFVRTKIGCTKPQKDYGYNFGDGWYASIKVEQVDAKESAKLRKKSKGFCMYDWMVDSIIRYNEIKLVK